MIFEVLLEKFGYDEPIFASEILLLFKRFTKAYVYRILNKEIKEGKIIKFDHGVYYLPQDTEFGKSLISPNAVAQKRYISNGHDVYGILSSLSLAYRFRLTEQIPLRVEIISNNESSKRREIDIDGRKYIVKRSKFKISKDNVAAYTILQLITENEVNEFTPRVIQEINDFIKTNNVKKEDILQCLPRFPKVTSKRFNVIKNII